jgi:molybdenum cofactor biosynthesis enzyme MoaA
VLQRSSVNISLDTTHPTRFAGLTGGGRIELVLAGIEAARRAGFRRLKLNAVLLRSLRGERLCELVRFAAGCGSELRLLELVSHPFCAGCDRPRLDARGRLHPCLRSTESWNVGPSPSDCHSDLGLEVGLRAAMKRKNAILAADRIWPSRSMAATGG